MAIGLLKISAYTTRGNGKTKLIVSFSDKALSDGQAAMLALNYLQHTLKSAAEAEILSDAEYDPNSGDLQ